MLTVVVPTYKRPDLLRECLGAIAVQTYSDFVVLVCDNSPEREAESVVADLADERFLYRPREHNLGILGNAMKGFAEAATPWVMEVDDDDLLHPRGLELLMAQVRDDPELVAVFGGVQVVDFDRRPLSQEESAAFITPSRVPPGRHHPFVHLAIPGLVYMVSAVLRADAVSWSDVPPAVGSAYDRYVVLTAACGGGAAFHVDAPVVSYRVHAAADGVAHEVEQVQGLLSALSVIRGRVPVQYRSQLAEETLRSRLMLVRAYVRVHDWRRMVAATMAIIREGGIGKPLLGLAAASRRQEPVTATVRRLRQTSRSRQLKLGQR